MKIKTRTVKLGVVGVDSGQLLICDPVYLESQYQKPDSDGKSDHGHEIFKHTDGSLWQFCYSEMPAYNMINKFPGTYETIIPKYGKTPNALRKSGEFTVTDIDPTPHIPENEFSYRGICKTTNNTNQGGQLNYLLGHAGAGVAFRSGMGDGEYEVFAELIDCGTNGERVKKVWVELITDEELRVLHGLSAADMDTNTSKS